ncbi:Phosphatidylglycerol/phosphatidylinositol transfer protein [Blomia tropicalis]|nr:Phosphatidylglycerol/phosphatidylinositol transfer protein [Blomia tropicalis]WBV73461.1 allergen [Blomia tropicalis]
MFKFTIIVTLFAIVAASDNIRFHDCANHEISSINFSGCTSEDRECKLYKGKDNIFKVHFTANQDSPTVKLEMLATIGGIEIPVPGLETDACKGHVKCPLVKGQKYDFVYNFNLPVAFPNVHAVVVTKLVGSNGVLTCGKMNGVLV